MPVPTEPAGAPAGKYRLYVDEVGNPDLGASSDPNHRYLSLTGVAFDLEYVRKTLSTELESIKTRFFKSHPDDPVILHRKELVNRRYPFHALNDPNVEAGFNQEILDAVGRWEFVAFTVVIDKLEHQKRYSVWQSDPYHYCLHVLVERYVLWLERRDAAGDVMAESRGGREDRRLKASFERVFDKGTTFISAERIRGRLTSRQLKVKNKSNNIAGLQLADLVAHPGFRAALARANREALPDTFGGKIARILEESKYDKSDTGRIEGWGRKVLP
jgi:hypothetical protein